MSSILVVEDEEVLRCFISLILNAWGYAVTTARDGMEAVEALRKKDFDLVVTDLVMPGRAGGELIEHLSRNYPGLPVIILTAYPTADSAIDAVRKGVADYLTKPFKTEEFLKSVRKALERERKIAFSWEKLRQYRITNKEEAILKLIVEDGVTRTREIAERLQIKDTTVKQHLENIYGKFGVRNKASLISGIIKLLR